MKMYYLTMISIDNYIVVDRVVHSCNGGDDLKGTIELLAMKFEIKYGVPFICAKVEELAERRNG